MERYGDEQPSRSETVKQAMRDKREEKYGDPSIGSDKRDRAKPAGGPGRNAL